MEASAASLKRLFTEALDDAAAVLLEDVADLYARWEGVRTDLN